MIKKINKKLSVDKSLLIIIGIILLIGAILVFSASWPEGVLKYDNGYFFFIKHIKFMVVGLVAMFFASNFNYKYYKKLIIPIIVIAVILNLLLFTSLGEDKWGSTRWIKIKGIIFMPSDILKIASIMFMSYYLEGIGNNIRKAKGVFLSILFIIFFVVLVFIRDMGTSIVMLAGLGSILIVSGIHLGIIGLSVIMAIFAAFMGIKLNLFPYRLKRLVIFLDPFGNYNDGGMQIINSLYALAMGGIIGVGLGKGVQKFSYIPSVYNDFIFTVMGEEFGLLGTLFLVLLYFLFLWRGYLIASRVKNKFGKFLAVGLTTLIVFQAFIHIMVNIGLAPVTGITLPFISYGGTSLLITMYSAGILLNISKES